MLLAVTFSHVTFGTRSEMLSKYTCTLLMISLFHHSSFSCFLPPVYPFLILSGQVPYEQHLFPRVKALQLCISELGDCADAVYDVTAAYAGTQNPDTLQRLNAPSLTGECGESFLKQIT